MLTGCLPQRWPIWLKPELVEMDAPALGPFPASHPITRDGRIVLVPTPGHVDGHVSVIVRGEPDGPVKFHYPSPALAHDFGLQASA